MEGICCRGLFRYLHKTLTWFITLILTCKGRSGFCSKSLFCAGWGEALSCFFRLHEGHILETLMPCLPWWYMSSWWWLNYFNSLLTRFRALPSTDLTESAGALYLLFQVTTAVLPFKKEIRKLTENHEISSGSFSFSEIYFCLLFLLLCFLSFSPSYKEHIIKVGAHWIVT